MSDKKWRNPYDPLNRNRQKGWIPPFPSLGPFPRRIPNERQVKASVTRMRSNIKGIGQTIRQVEETMNSLSNAMEILGRFGSFSRSQPVQETGRSGRGHSTVARSRHSAESGHTESLMGNIDVEQIMQILQSPLVQSLLSSSSGSSPVKKQRKKEG